MKHLLNRTFYRFTLGFIGILLVSFFVATVASYMDEREHLSASVFEQDAGVRGE